MGENSNIAWTHHTFNPWLGCDKIAPECAKCYIDRVLRRMGREPWGELHRAKSTWNNPAKWEKKAAEEGKCYRVFTCSLSDFFHGAADAWRPEAWKLIKSTRHLVYLILTKRPSLIASRLPEGWPDEYPNVWLGTSVGCAMTRSKMDELRKIPVHDKAVRFLSAEPLLEDIAGAIDLDGFDWVIAGGESGGGPEYLWSNDVDWRKEFHTGGRRHMKLEWATNLLTLAQMRKIPFFFKQISAPQPGYGAGALGAYYEQFPAPPMLEWAL